MEPSRPDRRDAGAADVTERRLVDLGSLSPAEEAIVASLDTGMFDRLGDGAAPEAGDASREVRAALIRLLILGAPDAPRLHEKGLRLSGAWITGVLDLEGCRIRRDVGLADCRFEATPILRSAVIDSLFLDGSILPGLAADRLEARGGVYLRGTRVDGAVQLRGARVGGDAVFDNAALAEPGGVALEATGIETGGDFTLRGVRCRGAVVLADARLGGNLGASGAEVVRSDGTAIDGDGLVAAGDVALRSARVSGETRFVGARIGGDVDLDGGVFEAAGGQALVLNRATVAGALFLLGDARISGALSLTGAALGAISDERASWPGRGELLLNRCRYGGFLGAPVDAASRLDWLSRQDPGRWGEDFWPQPYEQLSAVLSEMGHGEDAHAVLMVKERLQRRARRARAGSWPLKALLALRDGLLRVTVGYGLQPLRALSWLVLFWAAGAALYAVAWSHEQMRPNVAVMLRSPEWVLCGAPTEARVRLRSIDAERAGLAAPDQSQLACFLDQPEAGAFPRFSAWMFSLDALIPGLETGQRSYWSPDTRQPLGAAGKYFEYVQAIAGWALGLLAVAGFSGIVKSR